VTPLQAARRRRQAGYTLIEVVIATAIGLLVMGSLTSVVMTTVQATNTATSRVEASGQIRGFQLTAYDDFALSQPPAPCGTQAAPCDVQPLVLQGSRMANQESGAASAYVVKYMWDRDKRVVTRQQVDGTGRNVASNVYAYSWYVDGTGARPTVVISMTVTVGFIYKDSYSQSQTMRFYPRVTTP
jgi:prepilin-type N-terminal cleavage/methylation domain-containing protein